MFQIMNVCFMCVIVDNIDNCVIVDCQFVFFQCVMFDLFWQQVMFSNIQFFVFGIIGQMDYFYMIQQWCWNVYGVGSGDKYYIVEIVIYFQVMIVECYVLFWIQYFQQCGSWIVVYVRRYFVDFIEQEQWVFNFYFGYFLDQFIWYRVNVSLVMIVDFCFIMYVVQCYMDVFMFCCFSDGLV